MNAYVMTAEGVRVVEGAGWLEVHPDDIVLIRSSDPERRPMAAVKLSDRLWVAIGERPPERWTGQEPVRVEALTPAVAKSAWPPGAPPIVVGDGGWPPEPPPDVDSEG